MNKGFPFYGRKYVLDHVKNALHNVQADIVFLQEIMGHHPPDKPYHRISSNQFEFIADTLWPHYAYGKNAVYTEGNHGNAILSQYPLKRWENIDVSTNRLEKRGILHAEIELEGSNLHLLCVHFDLLEKGRRQQLEYLADRINDAIPSQDPLIVAGDFNDWRQKATETLGQRLELKEASTIYWGEHAKTYPSWLPVLALDRVYVRGLSIRECRVLAGEPWRKLSDHAALMVELEGDWGQ